MRPGLTIGDFSRITHLSVKTLRRYHEAGLLEPAEVDPYTGYRYYNTAQVPTAQVIRRFRDLGMPVREIGEVLATADPEARSALIAGHLERLESQLDQTRAAVTSLRRLLQPTKPPIEIELRAAERQIQYRRPPGTNLTSVMLCSHFGVPMLIDNGWGRIVNISSFVGQMGNFGQANYSAAKSGIIGFTKTAALELARSHVTVNAICPGFIETEMYAIIPEKVKEAILQRIPLGRVGTPQEVARAVRYLIVDGEYITGQTLNINGGIYM